MKIFFALFILIILAFGGYHLTFRRIRLPLFARKFHLTGTEFLFLGLLLGPQFVNLLDSATFRGLSPLSALLLGWVGLLFGFQFEIAKLRRFPLEYLGAALIEGGTTLILIAGAALLLIPWLRASGFPIPLTAALCLGAASACTAQTGLALLAPELAARRSNLVKLLSYLSTMDSLVAVLIFGLAFFFKGPLSKGTAAGAFQGPPAALAACGVLIVLYSLMTVRRCDETELTLIVIGMSVLASGAAAVLDFSPLIANALLGCGLVNFSRDKERIFQVLLGIEKPAYLMLLVFLGVGWRLDSPWVLVLGAGLCLFRLAGKWLGGALAVRLTPRFRQYPAALGFGLMDAGGLPLAILLDFQQRFSAPTVAEVVGTGLFAVVFTNLISPQLLGRAFKETAYVSATPHQDRSA